jgi:hypothetical protein
MVLKDKIARQAPKSTNLVENVKEINYVSHLNTRLWKTSTLKKWLCHSREIQHV